MENRKEIGNKTEGKSVNKKSLYKSKPPYKRTGKWNKSYPVNLLVVGTVTGAAGGGWLLKLYGICW